VNELERLLRERMVKPDQYPEFYRFEREGEELMGEIVGKRRIRRDDGREDIIYTIRTADGREWSIPSYAVLSRLMEEQNVQPGDYVLIRYEGERRTRRMGRPAKLFSLGKVSREEARKLGEYT